jgi:superfamily II DNA or RNA helicase
MEKETERVLTEKIAAYLRECAVSIVDWVKPMFLKQSPQDWWDIFIIANLTDFQKSHIDASTPNLDQLDLSSLIRITLQSWNQLANQFDMKSTDRTLLFNLREVRNEWAHCGNQFPDDDQIEFALNSIKRALKRFGKSNDKLIDEINQLQNQIRLQTEKKPKSEIPFWSVNTPKTSRPEAIPNSLILMDLVALKVDPTARGIITNIQDKAGVTVYSVFINGKNQDYYSEQLILALKQETPAQIDEKMFKRLMISNQLLFPRSESLYSLNSARIDFVPYQFRPVIKMIKSTTQRLLIADSVGVGKTIEAGLIMKEMQARMPVERIAILCPKSLVVEHKWEEEMKRFDEEFFTVDGPLLRYIIKETNRNGEWPERYQKSIIPFSILQNKELLTGPSTKRSSRKPIGLFDMDPPPHFDMLIVDEAHHIRNTSSNLHNTVKYFVDNSDIVLFLTATPIQTGSADLYHLLNVLVPDIVPSEPMYLDLIQPNSFLNQAISLVRSAKDNWVQNAKQLLMEATKTNWGKLYIDAHPSYSKITSLLAKPTLDREDKICLINELEMLNSLSPVLNRTRRQDIGVFCMRRTETMSTYFTEEQQELHDKLLSFEMMALEMMGYTSNVLFLTSTIRRQAASCIFGLAPMMKDIIQRRFDEINELSNTEFDLDFQEFDFSSTLPIQQLAREILDASTNLSEEDPKYKVFWQIVQHKQSELNNKIMVFSSFKHTLRYLLNKLSLESLRIGYIDGSVHPEERYHIKERFSLPKDDPNAIDLLLFTEIGSEGLDYQFCNSMINYDLPWNPMRIEQRIGRIDRRGQESEVVHIYNLITEDTLDALIYHRCLFRIGVFESTIGESSEILGKISKELSAISMDPKLTLEEAEKKIEMMTDNHVREINEIRQFENENKLMFGIDTNDQFELSNQEIVENLWTSPDMLEGFAVQYLESVVGKKDFLLGNEPLKTLRLSQGDRFELLNHFKSIPQKNTYQFKKWKQYLLGNTPALSITFDSDYAKSHPETLFITRSHPLLLQAAKQISAIEPVIYNASIVTKEAPKGIYPFCIYVWNYRGYQSTRKLLCLSKSGILEEDFMQLLRHSYQSSISTNISDEEWNSIEILHRAKWDSAKNNYSSQAKIDLSYREQSLDYTYKIRLHRLEEDLNSTKNEKIKRMKEGELANLNHKHEIDLNQLRNAYSSIDIEFHLLVKGVLEVNE